MKNIKLVLLTLLVWVSIANSMNQEFKIEHEEKEISEERELIPDLPNDVVKYKIMTFIGADGSTIEKIAESINNLANLRTVSKKWKSILTPKEIIRIIKENKIDVNLKDEKNNTALHIAAQRNYLQVAKILIALKADVNVLGNSEPVLIEHIRRNGYTRIPFDLHKLSKLKELINEHARYLIESGRIDLPKINIRAIDITPFLDACFNNNFELALLLLSNNANNLIFKSIIIELPHRKRRWRSSNSTWLGLVCLLPDDLINKINSLEPENQT